MNVVYGLVATLYGHFLKMKIKGRDISPWVQTTFVLSLWSVITLSLAGKIMMDFIHNGYYQIDFDEQYYLLTFAGLLVVFFLTHMQLFFSGNKHIKYYETYTGLPNKSRFYYRLMAVIIFIVLPFLLLFVIYLDDLYFRK